MKHTRYGFLPNPPRGLSPTDFVGIIVILLFMGLVLHTLAPSVHRPTLEMPSEAQRYYTKEACDNTECWIVHYANQYNVDSTIAIRIAHCESSMDVYARNTNSTASGLYQFIESTFANYCSGNVFNEHDNIQCFMELYPVHPEWWQCT